MTQHLREKRQGPRYPHIVDVSISALPPLGSRSRRIPTFHGRTRDISANGLCLVTDWPIDAGTLMRCNITLPFTRVAVPTLMQVRWSCETKGNCIAGMQFLF